MLTALNDEKIFALTQPSLLGFISIINAYIYII